jgi:hypothetical protein
MSIIEGMDKRLDEAHKTATESAAKAKTVDSFEARLKTLETLLETDKAQPASGAASTVVNIPTGEGVDIKALEEALTALKAAQAISDKATGGEEFDPFYGDLKVKKR